jgi:hypothetical protein
MRAEGVIAELEVGDSFVPIAAFHISELAALKLTLVDNK